MAAESRCNDARRKRRRDGAALGATGLESAVELVDSPAAGEAVAVGAPLDDHGADGREAPFVVALPHELPSSALDAAPSDPSSLASSFTASRTHSDMPGVDVRGQTPPIGDARGQTPPIGDARGQTPPIESA
jgi:hypothetical protein